MPPSLSVGAGLGNTIGGILGASLGLTGVRGIAPMTLFVIVMK
ncbi:hypothetical protein [Paracoccus laeviglucosivorans]|nr:hypothetical protein [Paracoccus laeviglucosivorans]